MLNKFPGGVKDVEDTISVVFGPRGEYNNLKMFVCFFQALNGVRSYVKSDLYTLHQIELT